MSVKVVGPAAGSALSASIKAVIIRACTGCESPMVDEYGRPYESCPKCGTLPLIEDQGTIAYWHRNPIRRLLYWIRKKVQNGPVYT